MPEEEFEKILNDPAEQAMAKDFCRWHRLTSMTTQDATIRTKDCWPQFHFLIILIDHIRDYEGDPGFLVQEDES